MARRMGERWTLWRHVMAMILVVVPLSMTSTAAAGDSEDALEAYRNGDYAVAHRLLLPLAEQGDAVAQVNLGNMYANGRGVPQDADAAVRWYRLAAEQGYARAQVNLGTMYANGHGVPQDFVQAHTWFNLAASRFTATAKEPREKAVNNGEIIASQMIPAQIAEAQKQARQWRPAKSYAEALERIERDILVIVPLSKTTPAAAGDFEDGIEAHQNGDYAVAHRLLLPFAERGDAFAQFYLGYMHETGDGVPQDYAAAARWYRLAAEQGVAAAQLHLGDMYDNGRGVPQDYAAAARWYRLAAEQGFAHAQINLGILLGNGHGVPQDHVQAHMWFNLAASRFTASQWVSRGEAVKNRDITASLMTPAQIAEAQKRAREWRPSAARPAHNAPDAPRGTAGLSSASVAEAQRLLSALGFDAGPPDGAAGPRTRSAVRAYQRARELPMDGKLDAELLEGLRRDGK